MRVGRHTNGIYLQKEFTDYLKGLDLAQSSIKYYTYYTALFFNRVNKEALQVTKSDILNHLKYLKNQRQQQNQLRQNNLIGLNHYFTFLLKKEAIVSNPCAFLKIRGTHKKSLHRIYTPEELRQLYDSFYLLFVREYDNSHIPKNQQKRSELSRQRNAVILNLLIHQGVTTKEISTLQLCDLDLMNATLKIRGARKGKERVLPLEATQIGVLMNYLQNIRPQLLEYQPAETPTTESSSKAKFFLSFPNYSKHKTAATLMHVFKPLTKQVQTLDKNFLNFQQLRASVITNWLKVYGLRKTQVLAGHRCISSTEKYKANDLESLINDIDKLHPF